MLVSARQFGELGVTGRDLEAPQPVAESPRALSAVELLEEVAEQREMLPGLYDGAPPGSEVRRALP